MKKLQKLQQEFINTLNNFDKKENLPFLNLIENSATLSASQRLAIYQDSMIEGLITALQDIFPVCQKIVGEEFFRAMAKKYVYQTPSTSPDLGDYGATFPQFIATFPPAQSLPYLSDVALLEWIWHKTLHGPNNVPFDFNALANISEDLQGEIIFQLPKNSFLINSKFPIGRIWEIHQANYTEEFSVNFNIEQERLFIYKSQQVVKIITLSVAELNFLQKITQQKTLAQFNEQELNLLPTIMARELLGGFVIHDQNC